MVVFRVGSKGQEVRGIQEKLKADGLYKGTVDGVFGGGTEAAVRAFQKANGLDVDGVVGPLTFKALAGGDVPVPEVHNSSLALRCLALTGAFETSTPPPDCFAGLTGDFDGQGISFGVLQWNFGQGSLPPLLTEAYKKHPELMDRVFGANAPVLKAVLAEDRSEQLAWSRSIQNGRHVVNEPWRGQFKTLGRSPEFQEIEAAHASGVFASAVRMAKEYGLTSERAVALMFDIVTQNGSIKPTTKAQIVADFALLSSDLSREDMEVARMKIVARRRAAAANPRFFQDVLDRKLTIAEGTGKVHGDNYDLGADYGIGLNPSPV